MNRRRAIIALGTIGLTACAGAPAAPATPVVVTAEVTRVVRQTVITRETVVVTATPRPATATPIVEAITLPTPTLEATGTPAVKARTTRNVEVYGLPDEENYNSIGTLPAGAEVFVVHRGGQWFEINSGGDAPVAGWVYRDWIDLPADQYASIRLLDEAQPILVGTVVQEFLGGGTIFKGRVLNIGAQPAFRVQVEVEMFDRNHSRVDLAYALTDPSDIASESTASFRVISLTDAFNTYIARVTWDI